MRSTARASATEAIAGMAGAGDAFASGVLLVDHAGGPMGDALRLGACAAAMSLQHASCSGAVGSAQDCLRLGARWGFRPLPR